MYLVAAMSFLPRLFSYANMGTWPKIKKQEITLPVLSADSDEIDFDYMEARIRELEEARIRELEAYIKAAGFENCDLTEEEQSALDGFAAKSFKPFKIGTLFMVETPKKKFNANAVKFGGIHPYVVRTSQNNGHRGTIVAEEKWLNPANTISFGQDTATIFFQSEPYFTGDKIKVMSFKSHTLAEFEANYLIATMRKAFAAFQWGVSSFDESILKGVEILLPVNDSGAPDLAFMETFIRAQMKEAVRGVWAWRGREIAATRSVASAPAARPQGSPHQEERRSNVVYPVVPSTYSKAAQTPGSETAP